ncbi:MAG: tetratricopeptide repeat protein [Sphingomonadales bacterium]|nr:MAG: tetratricopeptide repeat protein [Sphingomonadales bacterium]
MSLRFSLALLPLLLAAPSAFATQDRVASAEIARGDFAAAEAALNAELRIHPGRPELLLNLAAVYANTGRSAEARALYAQVLDQRAVLMDVRGERVASSHLVATSGMRRMQANQLSAR